MVIENTLLVFLYSIITAVGMYLFYPHRKVNPVFWFLPLQWIIAAGTIVAVDFTLESDRFYVLMFNLAQVAFIIGGLVATSILDTDTMYQNFWKKEIVTDAGITKFAIKFILFFSIFVTYLYYKAVGYNLLLDIILGNVVESFATARLDAYSGENYYAPGYANQFKNALLPLCLSVTAAWAWFAGKKSLFKWMLILGVPLLLVALLGTGQRAFLIYAFVATIFGVSTCIQIPRKYFVIGGTAVFLLFGLFSLFLGRIGDFSVGGVFIQLLERIFITQQHDAIVGFRYIHKMDVVWFKEWGEGFAGLSPWHKGSMLQHHVFSLIYGSRRGTAAVTTVGSVYHNGGSISVLLVYFFMGFGYMMLYARFLVGKRSVLRGFAYGAVFFYLAFWVSGPPLSLINKGFLAFLLILVIRKIRIGISNSRAEKKSLVTSVSNAV